MFVQQVKYATQSVLSTSKYIFPHKTDITHY